MGVPPRMGSTVLATNGSSANISSELANSVAANRGTMTLRAGVAPSTASVEAITIPSCDDMDPPAIRVRSAMGARVAPRRAIHQAGVRKTKRPALVAPAFGNPRGCEVLLLLQSGGGCRCRATLVLFDLEVVVLHVDDVDPGVSHLVDGAIAPAHPLIRIGIALLGDGVV